MNLADFDERWFRFFNGWLVHPAWAMFFFLVALYGIVIFLLIAVYLWYTPRNQVTNWHHKKTVIQAGLTVLVVVLMENFFDVIVARPRPYAVYSNVTSFNVLVDNASFPSLHVAVTFGFATALYLMRYRKLAVICFLLGILIGVARIVAGVHYPTDILAGMIVGVLVGLFVHKEAWWLRQYLPGKETKE